MVGWKKITKPKKEGGLGLQSAKEKILALLAKLNWRLHNEKDAIWARVISQKYGSLRRTRSFKTGPRLCSVTWAGMKKGASVFNKGIKWLPGRESGLSLWFDKWHKMGPLRSLIEDPLNRGEEHLLLKDINGFNGWKWESISFNLPKSLALEIKATPFPLSANGEDRIAWATSASGDFVLKEAYHLARNDDNGADLPYELDWVWKVPTIPKIKCFIWQCYHLSIPTRSMLIARGMNLPNHCPICNEGSESIIHLLRDCPLAKEL